MPYHISPEAFAAVTSGTATPDTHPEFEIKELKFRDTALSSLYFLIHRKTGSCLFLTLKSDLVSGPTHPFASFIGGKGSDTEGNNEYIVGQNKNLHQHDPHFKCLLKDEISRQMNFRINIIYHTFKAAEANWGASLTKYLADKNFTIHEGKQEED